MTTGDVAMSDLGGSLPVPEFDGTPWVTPVPLALEAWCYMAPGHR